jgi:hypothetical protein
MDLSVGSLSRVRHFQTSGGKISGQVNQPGFGGWEAFFDFHCYLFLLIGVVVFSNELFVLLAEALC